MKNLPVVITNETLSLLAKQTTLVAERDSITSELKELGSTITDPSKFGSIPGANDHINAINETIVKLVSMQEEQQQIEKRNKVNKAKLETLKRNSSIVTWIVVIIVVVAAAYFLI